MGRAQPSLPAAAREALLAWYEPRARAYPWRRGRPNAYRTLVSELMLQQTQAARVVPIYAMFLTVYPTVRALAEASRADVLRAWAGLGYNRRAVSLHRAAQAVVSDHRGRVPTDPAALRGLPGVGAYTAAAVASIVAGLPVAAIDVNARRIVARVGFGRDVPDVPVGHIDATAARWIDGADPGAWNQAIMDLGREHCRAVPRCDGCPIAGACRYVRAGRAPGPPTRRQAPFDGSMRQVRGGVVDVLRTRPSAGIASLAHATGFATDRISAALDGLERDGVVVRTGRSFRLPD
jgi:A/G-specific adenine glycosylase